MFCQLCGNEGEVKTSRKNKPFFKCQLCGVLMFVNKPYGIDLMKERIKKDHFKKESLTQANESAII